VSVAKRSDGGGRDVVGFVSAARSLTDMAATSASYTSSGDDEKLDPLAQRKTNDFRREAPRDICV